MEFKELLREYKNYNKERIKRIILICLISLYLLFLFFYNLNRRYGVSVQFSWFNGIISALITTITYFLIFSFIRFLLKAELVKVKLKKSTIIAFIGAAMLLFAGIISANNLNIKIIINSVPIVSLAILMPLILSIIGMLGIFLILFGKKYGNFLVLIAGVIAIVGMFIPIYKDLANPIPLVVTLIYIDPFLLLIGGVLEYFLKE